MANLPHYSTLHCGCPATYNESLSQYEGECHCDPEAQRDRWLDQERAHFRLADESRKRGEAFLYYRPFSLLR